MINNVESTKKYTIKENKEDKINNEQETIFTNKKIESIEFLDKTIEINSWVNILFTICDMLLNKVNFDDVLTLRGSKNPYFSKNESDLRKPKLINGTDIYIETNLCANKVVLLSRQIIALFNYSENNLKINCK